MVKLDYMGSAEFEFGALPASLCEITSKLEKYQLFSTPIKNADGETLFAFCLPENEQELQGILLVLRDPRQRQFYLKEQPRLDRSISTLRKDKAYGYIDLWWDIGNHWMVGFGKNRMKILVKGLTALQKRWKASKKI